MLLDIHCLIVNNALRVASALRNGLLRPIKEVMGRNLRFGLDASLGFS
jgi:hypothetical protein